MEVTNHMPPELLKRFAYGRLPRSEVALVLRHLAECDHCLEITNAFWLSLPRNSEVAIPPDVAKRLQQGIIEKIQKARDDFDFSFEPFIKKFI